MLYGVTTSIRLPPDLRKQLDEAAHSLHRGKNWIITKALQEYLNKLNRQDLVKEARRQSLLASKAKHSEDQPWEDDMDTSGWI